MSAAGHSTDPARLRVERAFERRFGTAPRWLARAPGRVNLLGAHVDYNEGWVLPGAIDRAIWVAARPAARQESTLLALDLEREGTLRSDDLPPPVAERPASAAPQWLDYPRGVAWALTEAGHAAPPLEVVFGGDLPIGAGVSSSAALEMAFLLVCEAAAGLSLDGLARARLGRRVENRYLGVASGIMDQFASLHGRTGHLLLLDCRSLEHELAPFPSRLALLMLDSGVRRSLADSAYNDRPRECAAAVAFLARRLPGIRALRDVSPEDLERIGSELPSHLAARARHVVEECGRVRAGAAALRAGDLATFGRLIRASHRSSRDLYQVSIPELDRLAESAWSAEGCHGARLSGAGLGGCVTALVDGEAAAGVERVVAEAFAERFGRRPTSFTCRIDDGAGLV